MAKTPRLNLSSAQNGTAWLRKLLLASLGAVALMNIIYLAAHKGKVPSHQIVKIVESTRAAIEHAPHGSFNEKIKQLTGGGHLRRANLRTQTSSSSTVDIASTNASSPAFPPISATLLCGDTEEACGLYAERGHCYGNRTLECKASCHTCDALVGAVTSSIGIPTVAGAEITCKDEDAACPELAASGQCRTGENMLQRCKASCGFCTHSYEGDSCRDELDLCPYLANHLALCASGEHWWMPTQCKRSCGVCAGDGSVGPVKVHKHLSELTELLPATECEDFHDDCAKWEHVGACQRNAAFMRAHCAQTCHMCGAASVSSVQLEMMMVGQDGAGEPALAVSKPAALGTAAAPGGPCVDENPACKGWAESGECAKNPSYMSSKCRVSCNACGRPFTYLPQPLAQVRLNNGVLMPTVGFGSAALGDGTGTAVATALEEGYRHIDSAQAREWYREDLAGAAIKASGIPRVELFLATKIHPRHIGYRNTLNAFNQSLIDLNTSYVDLLMLHYPACWGTLCDGSPKPVETWHQSWKALEELYRHGRVRAIGVSNFGMDEFKQLLDMAVVRPQVLQVHVDPLSQNAGLAALCHSAGVQMVAYSSLGTQWGQVAVGQAKLNPVMDNPHIKAIAASVSRSPAQVVLRWALQMGHAVLPRSSNRDHMAASRELFDFTLSEAQLATIVALDGVKPDEALNANVTTGA